MVMMRRIQTNVTPRQLEVLTFLARREQWFVGEVASVLGVSSAAATKVIVRLERKGLVTRSTDIMDRRCVIVRMTRTGTDVIHHSAKTI
jgi:DNA-binding MarR family transcriptional regulator